MALHESLLDLVGGTPLVRLHRLADGLSARVYVKLEYLNPGGSVKDRAALAMIDAAEAAGELRPGGTVVAPPATPGSGWPRSPRCAGTAWSSCCRTG